jgi:GAF domain-containing protein
MDNSPDRLPFPLRVVDTGGIGGDEARSASTLEEILDRQTRLAALSLGADLAAITLLDQEGVPLRSCIRLPSLAATRDPAPFAPPFFQWIARSVRPVVVDDTLAPAESRERPGLFRAYVGMPLSAADGRVVGVLCVLSHVPRSWTPMELRTLEEIAASAALAVSMQDSGTGSGDRLRAERNVALQQLALGLRHELNNTLSGLLLESQLITKISEQPEPIRASLESMERQIWRIHGVLARLDRVETLGTKPYLDRGLMIDLSEEDA